MTHTKKMTIATLALALTVLGGGARADEREEKAPRPPRSPTPLKVLVVFTTYQGEKKVASLPYTLSVSADDRPTRLRMGINVPLKFEGKEYPGNVVYKSVGNSVDCNAEALDDGRFKLALALEQSSLYAEGERRGPGAAGDGPPLLRTFNSEANLLLRDGQTVQYTAAADPVSGEVLKIEVTLNVAK